MPGSRTMMFDADGTVLEDRLDYLSWEEVRFLRGTMLHQTDTLMLVDRYNALSDEHKAELTALRLACRNLPQEQADRELSEITLPDCPQWIRDTIEPVVDWGLWDDVQSAEYANDHP